jgi:hypothetical protein
MRKLLSADALRGILVVACVTSVFAVIHLFAENPRMKRRAWWNVQIARFSNCTSPADLIAPLDCWQRQADWDIGNAK